MVRNFKGHIHYLYGVRFKNIILMERPTFFQGGCSHYVGKYLRHPFTGLKVAPQLEWLPHSSWLEASL